MLVLDKAITLDQLKDLSLIGEAHSFFDYMVKIVVDVKLEKVALNSELHSDLEEYLLSLGSRNRDLYGANILLEPFEIEYDSLINPPRNREDGFPRAGRDVASPEKRDMIERIVKKWIQL